MSHSHLLSLLNGGQERTFVVDFEGEDAMLIWCAEIHSVGLGRACAGRRYKGQSLERREHCKFELYGVGGWWYERHEPRLVPQRDVD